MTIEHPTYDRWVGATIGAYRLEELIGQSELGPIFGARGETPGSAYLLCLIAIQPSMSPSARAQYQSRFQQQAGHIATLQHPYILPLIDYGFQQDRPYVVWPYVAPRTLTARLTQSGAVDPLTAGRYLDQIAGALEYAHQHATLHRGLSTNCVYLQPDGRVVVADLGLRRMAELSYDDPRPFPLSTNYEACAPEQILNRRVDTYTDVYALGGVLYHLLTGRPVFDVANVEERAQQHVSAPVPPLSLARPGLPPALDGLLATALAKDPEQRFRQPGALANAYHDIVAPNQAARVPFITGTPALPGPHGTAAPSSLPRVSTRLRTPSATMRRATAAATLTAVSDPPARPTQAGSRSVRNALMAGLVILVVVGTVLGLVAASGRLTGASSATGQVIFSDNPASPPGFSDAFTVTIRGVAVPQNGTHYQAWIINSGTEGITALGTLTAKGNAYVLSGNGGGGNGQPGTSLLTRGDTIKVTQEQGNVKLPVGQTVLTRTFPTQAMAHVRHLLISFPTTPKQVGLLVGALTQSGLAASQALLLQSVVAGKDSTKTACVAQNLVNILEGTHGAHYKDLGARCAGSGAVAGDGFGLLGAGGYLADATDHASYAAIASDASAYIRTHASHVEIATTNITGWLSTVDRDAVALSADPTQTGVTAEIAQLSDRAYHGVDIDGDEQVDPVIGEAGAVTAYVHAQLMASLPLSPPQ
jgi:serine/threonine-protein kinase